MFGYLLILLSLVASSCGEAATSQQTPSVIETLENTPELTQVAPETPVTSPPDEKITLTFLYPGSADTPEGMFISNAVADFEDQYSSVSVDLQFEPSSEYLVKLLTLISAGTPPDLAKLVFYQLFELYKQEALFPLEELGDIDPNILTDALDSVRFDKRQYGMPLRRDSCALSYEYLSVFSGSQLPNEAFLLLDFLTQEAQQESAFKELSWYPVRMSSYDALNLKCSVNEAIRLPADQIQLAFDQVQERSKSLGNVLDGGTVLFSESTGVFENNELVSTAAPVWNPLSLEEAKGKMDSTGLVMGTLFIDNVEEYPPGDYALKCYVDKCVLVSPDGSEIDYDMIISEDLAYPVSVPRVSTEPGSKLECHYFLFWKRCTRVG